MPNLAASSTRIPETMKWHLRQFIGLLFTVICFVVGACGRQEERIEVKIERLPEPVDGQGRPEFAVCKAVTCEAVLTDRNFWQTIIDRADAPRLEDVVELRLPKSPLSDAAFLKINKMNWLGTLVLGDTSITDLGAEQLGQLRFLKHINLNTSQIGDEGLKHLAKLPELELLRFGSSNVTDAGLAALANCKSLRFLILQNAKIEGPGLAHLHGLAQLESLYLEGNPLSDDLALDQLKAALPKLHLHW